METSIHLGKGLICINAKKQGTHVAVKDALDDVGFAVADDCIAFQKNVMELLGL